ncbi:MAG: hypothetical protein U0V70_15150 [Terriglobia bacterium]
MASQSRNSTPLHVERQPTHAAHPLDDGDPNTAWSSYGSQVPTNAREWIRIDLPMETTLAVALVCSQISPEPRCGKTAS